MEFQSIQNAIDLLAQAPPPPPPPDEHAPEQQPGSVEPKLEIAWGGFHQGFWSSVFALFGPAAAKNFRDARAFPPSWVQTRLPKPPVIPPALPHRPFLPF